MADQVQVTLRHARPPSPDGMFTIRCSCLHGCRRRCPLGRRVACAHCNILVGPCCGLLYPRAPMPEGRRALGTVVCHVCVGDTPPRKCQWLPPPGDFPLMTTVQTLRWKHIAEQREAQRRELIWRDLDGEVRTLSECNGGEDERIGNGSCG